MALQRIHNVAIKGISSAVPKESHEVRSWTSFDSPEACEKYIESVGVERLRLHGGTMTCADLCQASAERLMEELGWKPEDVDMLVYVSQSMDYILPATACVLHGKMGLRKDCTSFDISLGCSGWTYGLSVVAAMMQGGGFKKVLLLAGDAKSMAPISKSRGTPLFGDAGTATALVFEDGAPEMVIDTQTDGTGWESIIIRAGGARNPFSEDSLKVKMDAFGHTHNELDAEMDGAAVFIFGISQVPRAIKNILRVTEQTVDDVDFFVFHQANFMMNEQIRRKCRIPEEKCPYCLRDFGNNSSASIPLTIVTQMREQMLQATRPQKIVACGFGVGLSWGTACLQFDSVVIPPLVEL